jgi:hypothetical protein
MRQQWTIATREFANLVSSFQPRVLTHDTLPTSLRASPQMPSNLQVRVQSAVLESSSTRLGLPVRCSQNSKANVNLRPFSFFVVEGCKVKTDTSLLLSTCATTRRPFPFPLYSRSLYPNIILRRVFIFVSELGGLDPQCLRRYRLAEIRTGSSPCSTYLQMNNPSRQSDPMPQYSPGLLPLLLA